MGNTDRLYKLLKSKGRGISILVPLFLDDPNGIRARNWRWLKEYWKACLPGAEIIIGHDEEAAQGRKPFSKSVAVNDAVSKAHGDVLVIIDADVLMSAESLLHCAKEIRDAEARDRRLWFMPYRQLYRLSQSASDKLLKSSPKSPKLPPCPPSSNDILNTGKFDGTPISRIGHWYGAMVQIASRQAFATVGGWDPRFKGWGGEDHAAMVAMDTLYGPHKTLPGQVLHVWHPVLVPQPGDDPNGKKRLWANQDAGETNNALSGRYYYSQGHPQRMRKLVDEFKKNIPSVHPAVDTHETSW